MTTTATHAGAVGESGQSSQAGSRQPRESRSGVAGLLDLVRDTWGGIARSARRTTGRLAGVTVALVVLCVVVAVVGALLVAKRADTTDALADHRQPQAAAAQELYRALSDADVTVARSFLYAGAAPRQLAQRYEKDIADAGNALAQAAADAGRVPAAAEQIRILTTKLPVYTALVERARASNEQGTEAGASYLREASELMRSTILPAAHDLYRINYAQLTREQQAATSFPWALTALVLLLLAALLATQIYLKRKTNRVFNVGLVVASGAVVVMLLWGTAAITVQSVLVHSGSESTAQANLVAKTRITALRARANEMLMLVAREQGDRYQRQFSELAVRLAGEDRQGGLLRRAQDSAPRQQTAEHLRLAMGAAQSWLGVHDVVRDKVESGGYADAAELAINASDAGSSTATFARMDRRLGMAIDTARQGFLNDTRDASAALTLLVPGVIVLSVLAALGSTIGLRDRLREYR